MSFKDIQNFDTEFIITDSRDGISLSPEFCGIINKINRSPADTFSVRKQIPQNFPKSDDNRFCIHEQSPEQELKSEALSTQILKTSERFDKIL